MFRNLRAEMARVGMTGKELAKEIGITNSTFSTKMNGKALFSLDEAFKIKKALRSRLSLDVLFERS